MNATVVGHDAQEDFASEAFTSVTQPRPASPSLPSSKETLPPTPHGICVNCGREVILRVVATDDSCRTYQWVPTSEPARRGRRCSEASMPAFHWSDGAMAAVYRIAI
ncbi:hypothetical protein [Promicromonospora sp. NPDC023805]|uniref:hypothetical protein n=1 Tax=Promicromonospora sp. NPDC023805 TaxID=3154696 RepID=UPI0033F79D26